MLYSGVGAIVVLILLVILYESFFSSPATCFDNTQNGSEAGIDCGGNCSLLCANTARSPVVEWARSFQGSRGTYSAVAYVKNNNPGAGARKVPYFFQLFDENNLLVVERNGVADIPPLATVPIIESNIFVGNRTVSRTLFAFTEDPPAVWNKVAPGSYLQLSVSQGVPAEDFSKLTAQLVNNNVSEVKNVTVVAILYDAGNTAIETSKSLIPRIAGRSQEEVVFTWPLGVSGAVRYEILVLPSF